MPSKALLRPGHALTAARRLPVATGSRASTPPVEGLREIRTWDDRDVITAKDVPQRLLVLGGGVVGCEMAQAYRDLGAREITIVERSDRLVGDFEPWASRLLAEAFDAAGIRLLTGRSVEHASREGEDGPVTVRLDDGTSRRHHRRQAALRLGRPTPPYRRSCSPTRSWRP